VANLALVCSMDQSIALAELKDHLAWLKAARQDAYRRAYETVMFEPDRALPGQRAAATDFKDLSYQIVETLKSIHVIEQSVGLLPGAGIPEKQLMAGEVPTQFRMIDAEMDSEKEAFVAAYVAEHGVDPRPARNKEEEEK
jgi:hypothetical protein